MKFDWVTQSGGASTPAPPVGDAPDHDRLKPCHRRSQEGEQVLTGQGGEVDRPPVRQEGNRGRMQDQDSTRAEESGFRWEDNENVVREDEVAAAGPMENEGMEELGEEMNREVHQIAGPPRVEQEGEPRRSGRARRAPDRLNL